MANPCLQPQQSDFRGYPFTVYTETKSVDFQKNNCPGSQSGSWEEYSKTYTSYISEEDLQQQIADDAVAFNAAGQANANATGTCISGCNVTQRAPYYIPAAINASQIWANTSGYMPGTPQSKASWNTGNLLPTQGVITNVPSIIPWITKYPHNSADQFYGIITSTNLVSMLTKTSSSGTACSFVPSRIVYTAKTHVAQVDTCGTATGVLMVVKYGSIFDLSEKGFDITFVDYDTGTAELLLYVPRPSHPDYIANSSMMIYDGTSAWVYLKFQNRNHPWRTRTYIYRVDFSGSSKTLTMLLDGAAEGYSSTGADPIVGVFTPFSAFFIYGERSPGDPRRRPKLFTMYGTPPDLPPDDFFRPNDPDLRYTLTMNGLRDPTNNNFYIGSGNSRLARYNASTNNWSIHRWA